MVPVLVPEVLLKKSSLPPCKGFQETWISVSDAAAVTDMHNAPLCRYQISTDLTQSNSPKALGITC